MTKPDQPSDAEHAPTKDAEASQAAESESTASEQESTEKKEGFVSFFKRLGPAGVLAIAWTAMPPLGGILLLAFIGDISAWLETHQLMGVVLYSVLFMFSAGFGALPTYSQALLGGWAFGPVVGFLAAWAGFVGASLIGYTIARTISKRRVEKMIDENAKARAVRDALIGHGLVRTTAIVALIRVPPNSPFALTNLAMAASGVRLVPYVVGTALGMAPRTFAAVWLASEGAKRGDNLVDLFKRDRLEIIIALVVTFAVLGVIGYIAKRALEKVSGAQPKPVKAE
ncbi:MAG: VTT domain-containing protein [Phycisphaerales bacterium]|jgi:uncharacterized membrane protein YdjX (TVP38/TMEM64 family)